MPTDVAEFNLVGLVPGKHIEPDQSLQNASSGQAAVVAIHVTATAAKVREHSEEDTSKPVSG